MYRRRWCPVQTFVLDFFCENISLRFKTPLQRKCFRHLCILKMPLSSECLGVNILYLKLVSFSLRGSYAFVPRLSNSTANFCIQTEGVDYWPTYSFFRWDKTLLGSPQTPGTRSAAGWHPTHPSPASQRLELTSVCHDTLLQFDCVLALHVTSVSIIPSAWKFQRLHPVSSGNISDTSFFKRSLRESVVNSGHF